MKYPLRHPQWVVIFCVGVLLPLFSILFIWHPVYLKYRVYGNPITPNVIKALRAYPNDNVLKEIGRQSLTLRPVFDTQAALHNAAEGILRGELSLPNHPTAHLSTPFHLKDLDQDGETLGLHLASLIDIRILLDAYAIESRDAYLAAAVKRFTEFAKEEDQAWLPHGFLWNDHAIAARISLSAELWRQTRIHPKYAPVLENILPLHVWRSMRLLAEPSLYTYATNHGVMQNIALLQAGVAFSSIPDAPKLTKLAIERLETQLDHYLSSENMVLEHSAGYHKHGVEILMIAIRAMELMDLPAPDWKPRVLKARELLEVIMRPDGSLPRFGNTYGDPEKIYDSIPFTMLKNTNGLTALPQSGYAIWRDSLPTSCGKNGTHLSFAASLFPGHGHKLADEGSLMLWSGGRVWFDNTGYWPYGAAGRNEVNGWRGSNAPHLDGEGYQEGRVPVLTHAQAENGTLFLEFSRRSPDSPTIRRQVIGVNSNAWLIIDSAENHKNQLLNSIWTFAPDLNVTTKIKSGQVVGYSVSDPALPCMLDMLFLPNDSSVARIMRGQLSPFGGWMMWHGQRTPTTAIETSQTADPRAVLFAIRGIRDSTARIDEWRGDSALDWQALIHLPSTGQLKITRKNNKLLVLDNNNESTLVLTETPLQDAEHSKISKSLQESRERYPIRHDYIPWRLTITKILAVLACISIIPLTLAAFRFPKLIYPLSLAGLIGWITVTLWLNFVYFQ